jgi:FixJ family two-component response regulator
LEAIEHLRFHEVDCILSDLYMPKLSGMQLLQILRANGFYKPYLVLSAFGSRADALELLRLGAMDFLEKPMDLKKLVPVVREAVRLGQALPALRDVFIKTFGIPQDELNPDFEKAIMHMAQLRFLRISKSV